MVRIKCRFHNADAADFALGRLKNRINIESATLKIHGDTDEELPVSYPVRPDYSASPDQNYLNGMPHVLESAPVFNAYFEPSDKKDCTFIFYTDDQNEKQAYNALLRFGAFDIQTLK